eukprot:SAG31_NODE_4369_length_3305_cov_2.653774_1_plen_337_part_00
MQVVHGRLFGVDVAGVNSSISELKQCCALECGIPAADIRLVWRGRVLADNESVASANITEHSRVILARKPKAPASASVSSDATNSAAAHSHAEARGQQNQPAADNQMMLTLKRVGTADELLIESASPSMLVQSLLDRCAQHWRIASARIVHGGRIVEPDMMLSDAGFVDGVVVHVLCVDGAEVTTSNATEHQAGENNIADDDDGGERICRICHDGVVSELGPLFSPCRCTGSMRYVHVECLNTWRRMSANPTSTYRCDLCGTSYLISRTKWAELLESARATEIATLALCLLLVAVAAVPSYWLSVHTHFFRYVYWTPWWHHSEAYWILRVAHAWVK